MSRLPGHSAILLAVLAITFTNSASGQVDRDVSIAQPDSTNVDQLSADAISQPPKPDQAAYIDGPQPEQPVSTVMVTNIDNTPRDSDRTLVTAPVGGTDRCAPDQVARHKDLCRHSLDPNGNENTRPSQSSITPEGRLLLLTNPTTPSSAAQQLANISTLNEPNGPAQQLAGALQEKGETQNTPSSGNSNSTPSASVLPAGVPTVAAIAGTK